MTEADIEREIERRVLMHETEMLYNRVVEHHAKARAHQDKANELLALANQKHARLKELS